MRRDSVTKHLHMLAKRLRAEADSCEALAAESAVVGIDPAAGLSETVVFARDLAQGRMLRAAFGPSARVRFYCREPGRKARFSEIVGR